MRHVTFHIQADEPDLVDRVICFSVFDGQFTSDPACVTLKIEATNEHPPVLNATALGEPFIEDSDGVFLLSSLEIIDADHPQLFPMQRAEIRSVSSVY